MKPVTETPVPADPSVLILMTVDELVPRVAMQTADFTDTHALFYDALGAWIGLGVGGLSVGRDPWMENGVWYVRRDAKLAEANPNHVPDIGRLRLAVLP